MTGFWDTGCGFYAGDYKSALQELQRASQNDPFIQCLLAQTYEKLGDKQLALARPSQGLPTIRVDGGKSQQLVETDRFFNFRHMQHLVDYPALALINTPANVQAKTLSRGYWPIGRGW